MATPPVIDSSRYFSDVRLALLLNFTPERAVISANAGSSGGCFTGRASAHRPTRLATRKERRVNKGCGKRNSILACPPPRMRRRCKSEQESVTPFLLLALLASGEVERLT